MPAIQLKLKIEFKNRGENNFNASFVMMKKEIIVAVQKSPIRLDLSISPITQIKKISAAHYAYFLTYILEEIISYASCVSYFSTVSKSCLNSNFGVTQIFLHFLLDGMNKKMYTIIDYKYIVNNNGRCRQKWKKKIKV